MEEDDYEYDDDSSRSRNTKQDDEETEDETPKDELANQKRGYSSQEKAMIEAWLRQNRPTNSEQ
jgi:hypothetical protein